MASRGNPLADLLLRDWDDQRAGEPDRLAGAFGVGDPSPLPPVAYEPRTTVTTLTGIEVPARRRREGTHGRGPVRRLRHELPIALSSSSGGLSVTYTGPLWFTGELPVVLHAFVEVRNAAAHGERIDRRTATEWRIGSSASDVSGTL